MATGTQSAAAVEVEDLTVRYGAHVAVDGLTFAAPAGATTALLGPNGAGKTTTVEVLEGYLRPDSGRVRVLGLDPVGDHARLAQKLGVMLQEGGVYTGIRVGEVLRLFASYYEEPRDAGELMEELELGELASRTWRQLSGGERQRLSFALALVGRPEVVFLDEPTSGIDAAGRRTVRAVLEELHRSGTTVLLTSHDLDEVERLADQVVILDHGRLVASGTPAELVARESAATSEVRFRTRAGIDRAALALHLGVDVDAHADGTYRIAGEGTAEVVSALGAWLSAHDLPLEEIETGRASLEDVFLRVTSADGAAGKRQFGEGEPEP